MCVAKVGLGGAEMVGEAFATPFCKAADIASSDLRWHPDAHRSPSDSLSTSIHRQILSQAPSRDRRSFCISSRDAEK
jgi:hypothetical protein